MAPFINVNAKHLSYGSWINENQPILISNDPPLLPAQHSQIVFSEAIRHKNVNVNLKFNSIFNSIFLSSTITPFCAIKLCLRPWYSCFVVDENKLEHIKEDACTYYFRMSTSLACLDDDVENQCFFSTDDGNKQYDISPLQRLDGRTFNEELNEYLIKL